MLNLRDFGTSGDIPVLLLHGMGANTYWWDPVVPHLKGFKLVALDFRGHGDSGWREDSAEYGLEKLADDVADAVRTLGWDQYCIAAHSMGGRVSLEYAGRRPEGLQALAALDFLGRSIPQRNSRFARGRPRLQPTYESEEAILSRFRLQPEGTTLPDAEVRTLGRRCVKRLPDGRWTWKFHWMAFAIRYSAVWPSLSAVQVPTLVIRGSESRVMAADELERVVSSLPDAQGATLAGAYHHVTLDQPRETAELLSRFFLSRWRARGASVRLTS